ncbi:hypothetical protein B9G69_009140 [Bdellovibrio sp. SKB1291214]|uniref:hypothetical protein n=1 Tax=Bdellovibrio sp. SKB1291214 TaxID=1732569 RepID=UPI000B51C048|nr:hypothetical protein [Bdellovibrio sp. SKB1291214]UYL10738.1 hypothetical protein B9G69_009140 [Bdellovibrio sp. SKB1291214]
MKLLITILILGLALTACKPVEDSLDDGKTPGKVINETDYSSCGTGNYGTSVVGTWFYQQGIGNTKFTKTYTFSRDYLRLTNDCNFDGVTVRATATSRYTSGVNTMSFLDSALNENPIQREGYKLVCQSKIEPSDFTWRFQGNCLVIVDQTTKASITLLPGSAN